MHGLEPGSQGLFLSWNCISSPVLVFLAYFRCQIATLSCFLCTFSASNTSSVIDSCFFFFLFPNKVYLCLWVAVYVQIHVCTHVGGGVYVCPCGMQRVISIVSVHPVF